VPTGSRVGALGTAGEISTAAIAIRIASAINLQIRRSIQERSTVITYEITIWTLRPPLMVAAAIDYAENFLPSPSVVRPNEIGCNPDDRTAI
jgi:hypothetical protein